MEKGIENLLKHVENITGVFGLPAVVALNRFPTDTLAELTYVKERCKELNVNVVLSEVWAKGSEGGIELAKEVVKIAESNKGNFSFAYGENLSIREKIEIIAKRIYGADGVDFAGNAGKQIDELEALGYGNLPVCIAKPNIR